MKHRIKWFVTLILVALAAVYPAMTGSAGSQKSPEPRPVMMPMPHGGMHGGDSQHQHDSKDKPGQLEMTGSLCGGSLGDPVFLYEHLGHHAGMLNLAPAEWNSLRATQEGIAPKFAEAKTRLSQEQSRLFQALSNPGFDTSKLKAQMRSMAEARAKLESVALEGIAGIRDALTTEHYSEAIAHIQKMVEESAKPADDEGTKEPTKAETGSGSKHVHQH